MSTERDTHFAGFARLLFEDWLDACGGHIDFDSDDPRDRPEFEAFIARRAYELVEHTLRAIGYGLKPLTGNLSEDVPDLTEWFEKF